jgi:hypothetical protein
MGAGPPKPVYEAEVKFLKQQSMAQPPKVFDAAVSDLPTFPCTHYVIYGKY